MDEEIEDVSPMDIWDNSPKSTIKIQMVRTGNEVRLVYYDVDEMSFAIAILDEERWPSHVY